MLTLKWAIKDSKRVIVIRGARIWVENLIVAPNLVMLLRLEHPPPLPTRPRDWELDHSALPSNMERWLTKPNHQALKEDNAPSKTYSNEDDIPADKLDGLRTLANNSVED